MDVYAQFFWFSGCNVPVFTVDGDGDNKGDGGGGGDDDTSW